MGEIFVSGMDCEFDHQSSLLEKIGVNVKACPDDQYCCIEDNLVYCCSRSEFVSNRQVLNARARTHAQIHTYTHTQSFHLNL